MDASAEPTDPATRELLRGIADFKQTLELVAVKDNLDLHIQAIEQIGKVVLVVAAEKMTADEGIRTIEKIIEPLEEPARMVRDFIQSLK